MQNAKNNRKQREREKKLLERGSTQIGKMQNISDVFTFNLTRCFTLSLYRALHMYVRELREYLYECACCIDSNGEASRIAPSLYRVGLNARVHY